MSQLPQLPMQSVPPLDERAGDTTLPPLFGRTWWLFFHALRSFLSDLSTSVDTLSVLTGTAGTYTKVTTDARGRVTVGATADLSGTDVTGILAAARFPALTGDITTSAGALATTLKNTGPGAGTYVVGLKLTAPGVNGTITIDSKGRITAIQQAT